MDNKGDSRGGGGIHMMVKVCIENYDDSPVQRLQPLSFASSAVC